MEPDLTTGALCVQLIKGLEAARGNGTSMISLIMPPKDQVGVWRPMRSTRFVHHGDHLSSVSACLRGSHQVSETRCSSREPGGTFGSTRNVWQDCGGLGLQGTRHVYGCLAEVEVGCPWEVPRKIQRRGAPPAGGAGAEDAGRRVWDSV